jgi:crotonobetainyl-CoA:carnitine CoA-transferase CaiB-like acyl-CoA transferase
LSSYTAGPENPVRFLNGLSVLEVGDGVASASAGAILALLGAAVTTVVDPAAAYRCSRPWLADDGPTGFLGPLLQADKVVAQLGEATVDDLEAIVASHRDAARAAEEAHIVIVDRVGGAPYGIAELHDADAYSSWVEELNDAAWVTVSAFGLSGPRRQDVATELTVSAVSGLLGSARDAATGLPLKLAGHQALLSAGQAAALASCHAVDLAGSGRPTHMDLSAQEAAIATGPMLALAQALLDAGRVAGANRYGAPAGFYACRDGLIRISAMEDHQWRGVVKAMGSPEWAEQFALSDARVDGAAEIDVRVGEWAKELIKSDAEALLQAEGVPATALNSPSEIISSPQLEFRHALRTLEVSDGLTAKAVGLPFKAVPSKADPEEGSRRRSLQGLRVLEAGRVLAIPLAGAILGALGAKVTKLEDLSHIDMYRRRAPFVSGEPGINRAAYFAMVNHSKTNLVTDLHRDTGELETLLSETDVVIENFGRRRADSLGLSAYALAASDRPVLGLSSSGFGYEGPYKSYRVYAYNLQTSCGLIYLTRTAAGEPAQMDMAWADLICGYGVATIVAAWAVGPRGNDSMGIDFAMAELVSFRFNEFLAAASVDPGSDDRVDRANEVSPFAPNGVYRVRNGWIAMSVGSDQSFARLCAALGSPVSLADDRFTTAAARFDARVDLDAALGAELADLGVADLTSRLRGTGICCEGIIAPADLITDAHLVDRGFFSTVEHPEWGRRRVIGIPWRPAGGDAIRLTAPPTMDPARVPLGTGT